MAITFVSQHTGSVKGTGQLTVNIGTALAANDAAVLLTTVIDQAITISTVTGGGVTWVRRVQNTGNATSGNTTEIWEGANATAGGSTSVIISYSAATNRDKIGLVTKWSGISTGGSEFDASATANGNSTGPNFGVVTTTNPEDLVIGAISLNNSAGSTGPSAGWSTLTGIVQGTFQMQSAYRIEAATGSFNSTWGGTANGWSGAVASFKGSTAGGPVGGGSPFSFALMGMQ